MKLTIIETGLPPEPMRADWPRYPKLFEDLLKPHIDGLETETVSVVTGEAFPDLEETQAVLITGSAAGVYESHPWMEPLFQFIRQAAEQKTPQIGVCFGHQAIARALGANVEKSEKGWGIGRHTYEICQRPYWLNGHDSETFSLGVSHQDQVQSLPPGASVVAASDFTPFAVLDYGDVPAISFQGHPEFSGGFSCALYNVRRGTAFSSDRVDAACSSLDAPIDNHLVGGWMANFLRHHAHPG